MRTALIGYTGFLGSSLLRQGMQFTDLYNSANIETMAGEFDSVICCAPSAEKWRANLNPEEDAASVQKLKATLSNIFCNEFILISTADVFAGVIGVDEHCNPDALEPYGKNRMDLESFVKSRFPHLIIRLPGVVGPGLKKNLIFDLSHSRTPAEAKESTFQFYPVVNLRDDIARAKTLRVSVIHLTAEPLSFNEIHDLVFGGIQGRSNGFPLRHYDVRSIYAGGGYLYSKRESLLAIRSYAQSEACK